MILADGFFPLLAEPRLANHYRVISYHRRGSSGMTDILSGLRILTLAFEG